MIKLVYIRFLLCIGFLFISCPPGPGLKGGPSYPSDIVTDVGTLKYIRTLWDETEIYAGQKVDNEIWIYALNDSDYRDTLFKGIDKSASLGIKSRASALKSIYPPYILPKGNYINFLVGNRYEDGTSNPVFYTLRVHKATMDHQESRIPILCDNGYWPSAYCGNGDVFFCSKVYDNSIKEFIYYYYMLNETCDNVIEITEQEFHDLYSPNPGYVTDDEGRYYRLNNREFEVSVDNGTTWHGNSMGTNSPHSIILQNDSVYVLCGCVFGGGTNPPTPAGGGIHEFKWETKSGEE
jgi:hypothetical protein